jgi:hypothetical protein
VSTAQEAIPAIAGRRSTAVWGAVAGAGVLATIVAYFCYAHLYLGVSNEPWPPEGTGPLPLLEPVLLSALVLTIAAGAVAAGRPLPPSDDQLPRAAALGTVTVLGVVATGAGGLLVADLDLAATSHAHDASVLTLHAIVAAAAVAGVVITGLASFEAARIGDHPWVAAAVAVSAVWWVTVAIAWVAVAAVVYGWPQVT